MGWYYKAVGKDRHLFYPNNMALRKDEEFVMIHQRFLEKVR